jgi:integrase/recombinase XerD
MTHSNQSVSPLRQRMIDDMTMRRLNPKTQAAYLRAVFRFTRFFGRAPDLASPEDLRAFQLHLVAAGVSSTTINATITGLKFFFGVSLERPAALKHRAALAVAYGAGLRASEVVHLKVTDIDSERMIVRVNQGKGRRDRYAMLSPSLLQLLRAAPPRMRWFKSPELSRYYPPDVATTPRFPPLSIIRRLPQTLMRSESHCSPAGI